MTDYFAVLRQPRKPWLDPNKLKQQYQELTLAGHPDRHGSNESPLDFALVNEAYRVLTNPKLRLQHLLSMQGSAVASDRPIPTELVDLFSETATLARDIDDLLERLKAG